MEDRRVAIKSGFVTIIGLPNAGKSTLLNSIINENIAITSRKPQTTRKKFKGIYNDDLSQIIFVDTPGIFAGKTKLDKYMNKSIDSSLDGIDVVIVLVDINTYKEDDYTSIINKLKKTNVSKILIINKCDVFYADVYDGTKFNCTDYDLLSVFSAGSVDA